MLEHVKLYSKVLCGCIGRTGVRVKCALVYFSIPIHVYTYSKIVKIHIALLGRPSTVRYSLVYFSVRIHVELNGGDLYGHIR